MSPRVLLVILIMLAGTIVGALFFRIPTTPHVQLPAEIVARIAGFPISNTMLAAWASILVLLAFFSLATRNMALVPGRLQNLAESLLEIFIGLADNVAGPKRGRQFFTLVMTLFLFILISNWMGLLPGYHTIGITEVSEETRANGFVPIISWASSADHATASTVSAEHTDAAATAVVPDEHAVEDETTDEHATEGTTTDEHATEGTEQTGDSAQAEAEHHAPAYTPLFRSANTDLNMTLALAIVSVIAAQIYGVRGLGFGSYFSRFFNFKGGPIGIYVGILELISELAKFVSFSFRLFGNVFAGEVLLAVIGFLIPWIVILPFYGLELFVGLIQAFVFAMLTLVFLTMATTSHDHDDAHDTAHAAPAHSPTESAHAHH